MGTAGVGTDITHDYRQSTRAPNTQACGQADGRDTLNIMSGGAFLPMHVNHYYCLILTSAVGLALVASGCAERKISNPQSSYNNPNAHVYEGPLYLPYVLLRGSGSEQGNDGHGGQAKAYPSESYPLPDYAIPQVTVPHGWQQITPSSDSPWVHEAPGFQWVPELPPSPTSGIPPTTPSPSSRYSCHYLMMNHSLVPVCHMEH